jgi:hypothetical protein
MSQTDQRSFHFRRGHQLRLLLNLEGPKFRLMAFCMAAWRGQIHKRCIIRAQKGESKAEPNATRESLV